MIDSLRATSIVLVVVCALLSWSFVFMFWPVRNKGAEGWHLLRFSLWLAIAFSLIFLQPILRLEYPKVWYTFVVFTLGAVASEMVVRLVMLVRVQHEGARELKRREREDATVRRSTEQLGSSAVDEPSTPGQDQGH